MSPDQPTPRVGDTRCPDCGGPARSGWWHTVDCPDAPHPAPADDGCTCTRSFASDQIAVKHHDCPMHGDAVERAARVLSGSLDSEYVRDWSDLARAALAAARAGEAVDREALVALIAPVLHDDAARPHAYRAYPECCAATTNTGQSCFGRTRLTAGKVADAVLAARGDAAPTDAECVEVARRAQARRGVGIWPETARAVIEAWREVRP